MQAFVAMVDRFVTRDEGQDLTEYGLIAALIAIVALAAVTQVGETIRNVLWTPIANNW